MRILTAGTWAGLLVAALGACTSTGQDGDSTSGTSQAASVRDYLDPPSRMGAVHPGRYGFTAVGDEEGELPVAVVDVPRGYVADHSLLLRAAPQDPTAPADDATWTAFTVWAVAGVYRDGCHDHDSSRIVPARSVEQVAALLRQAPGMHVSRPRPATFDGYEGLYLEVVSGDIDYAACNGGSYAFYETDPGTLWVDRAGIRENWWVLDMEGTPVIVATGAGPQATAEQRTGVERIARSAHFVTASG